MADDIRRYIFWEWSVADDIRRYIMRNEILLNERKYLQIFVIFSKKVLDKSALWC